ncbi:unnamed protein product [Staurois parvus]|uniref:Secreted protein n=1 Tax=Staurois parvus TaxID=386267 RepID=A0ABN9C1V0_9NEOB|nr:unnamed protein product [Staurois parvus]
MTLAIPMTLLLSLTFTTCLALVHAWQSTRPALLVTTVPGSEDHRSSKVIICKSCKQLLALLFPWVLDSLCSSSSGGQS